MAAPFYNAIKGTTAGTPGTSAFTPNAASAGYRPWSVVPAGWIGLVCYEDGSDAEFAYSYWNGTSLSRPAAGFFDSSTAAQLSLTSSATAAMVEDAKEVQPHLGGTPWRIWVPIIGSTTLSVVGTTAPTSVGTAASAARTATNYLTAQPRLQLTSATTANAQAGVLTGSTMAIVSTTAGIGGYEFVARFGASGIPTGPRLFIGVTDTTFQSSTSEPSALVANFAIFGKDSGDTNIQLMTNSGAGTGTKINTGIPLVVNGWYEASIWSEPGSTKVWALLIRLDTGDIWLGSTTTDVPVSGSVMFPQILGGLNGANTGTAIVFHTGGMHIRLGS